MVHWVYILECESDNFYVGDSDKLFKTLNEHKQGSGSYYTRDHPVKNIKCVYRLEDLEKFLKRFDNYKVSLFIFERLFLKQGYKDYYLNKEDSLKSYPLCHCGLPCDVKMDKMIYFRCPKKNFWKTLIDLFQVENSDPCDFFLKDEVFLEVPYKEKEEAKALGCHWNPEARKWYCNSFNDVAIKRWKISLSK